jgi:hypothetical protein
LIEGESSPGWEIKKKIGCHKPWKKIKIPFLQDYPVEKVGQRKEHDDIMMRP